MYIAGVFQILIVCMTVYTEALISLPSFAMMKENYPGFSHWGGQYHNNKLIDMIGCKRDLLHHGTSALRLSYSFNKVGGMHSLGKELIQFSKKGIDSVIGSDKLQYIYNPITYGPFLADKYGYPSITKLHQLDPISTKKTFWGKQGIMLVITYRKIKNLPVGHVALWDCDHFHETKDWISGHSLITAEFWESPDSNCSGKLNPRFQYSYPTIPSSLQISSKLPAQSNHQLPNPSTNTQHIKQGNKDALHDPNTDLRILLQNKAFRKQFIKKYFVSNGHLRHAKHRGLTLRGSKKQRRMNSR